MLDMWTCGIVLDFYCWTRVVSCPVMLNAEWSMSLKSMGWDLGSVVSRVCDGCRVGLNFFTSKCES